MVCLIQYLLLLLLLLLILLLILFLLQLLLLLLLMLLLLILILFLLTALASVPDISFAPAPALASDPAPNTDLRRDKISLRFALSTATKSRHQDIFTVAATNPERPGKHSQKYREPKARTSAYYNSAVPYLTRLLNSHP